jgi:hypothetical protein
MTSLFINAGLVAGVALAAIPVILHLFMKQTPKRVVFPALRLIQRRQERTRKKLRIKNWLLLLARMALLALMALALARPRFDAKIQAGDADVEAAIALVFDTSLSMAYEEKDKTRLDEAKALADKLLERTHAGSQVFVIDSARAVEPVAMSPAAARKAIQALAIAPANQSLNQGVGLAYGAVAGSEKPLRDVFVFTDLARSAWGLAQEVPNREKAEKTKGGVGTYVMNLGAPAAERHDVSIVRVEPPGGIVGQDEPVPIRTFVRSIGKPAKRTVEFYLDDQKRDQKLIEIPADAEIEVPPFLPRFPLGLHRVTIRLDGEPDPLPQNDAYFATFEVRPAVKVLVLSDLSLDAEYVANAIDPEALRGRPDAPRPYQVDAKRLDQIDLPGLRASINSYVCVYMLNVKSPAPELWQVLSDYVKSGRGLVVGVGDRVAGDLEAYNGPDTARDLLPATLKSATVHQDYSFGKADLGSTLFSAGGDTRALITELGRVPIYKSLDVEPIADARILLSYQDDRPALLERVVTGPKATGRVLLWTTALTRVPRQTASWNEFPIANWSFFQLMNQTVPYLAGETTRKLSVEAGETVNLPLDTDQRYTEFSAQPPGRVPPIRLTEPAPGRPISVSTRLLNFEPGNLFGQWNVFASRAGAEPLRLGFSVNPPPAESDLTALAPSDLDSLLGKDQYKVASSPEELVRKRTEGTVGRELFPWLMILILLLVTAENALANTFYRDKPSTTAAVPRARVANAATAPA